MAAKVHHVGIAVPNLAEAARFFYEVFGVGSAKVEAEQVKNLYIEFGGVQLQIMEDPGRLAGEPFGRLDHIAIQVDDLDETAERLKAKGVNMAWDMPVRVEQYRSTFTTDEGGVGVVFQLSDELGETRPSQPFKPDLMDALAKK